MPWNIVRNHEKCSSEKPWAVVKTSTGEVEGCSATQAKARAHQRALYASEGSKIVSNSENKMFYTMQTANTGGAFTFTPVVGAGAFSVTSPIDFSTVTVQVADEAAPETNGSVSQDVPWAGVLGVEGSPTSDKRYLLPGEISERDLPLPLNVQMQTAANHDGSDNAGAIEAIQHIPVAEFSEAGYDLGKLPSHAVVIWATGHLDASPEGEAAQRMIENGCGISLDLPAERTALIDPETYEEVDPNSLEPDELMALMFGMETNYLRGIGGKIGGATIVNIPAFEEARVGVIASGNLPMLSDFGIKVVRPPSLTASAAGKAPLKPPLEWFETPEPNEATPLTVSDDGRVFGHLALWNQCHTAFASCETPPRSRSGYKYFHLGEIETKEGEPVAVGRITVGKAGNAKGGHASVVLGTQGALEHYESTGCGAAFVRAKDGKLGIWLSGAVRSDLPAERIRDLRAYPPSGDWRRENGSLELVAALSVPVPGFPVPRSDARLVASGGVEEVEALILTGDPSEMGYRSRKRRSMILKSKLKKVLPAYEEEEEIATHAKMREAALEEMQWDDGFAISAEDRKRYAKSGASLPDGSYPITKCTGGPGEPSADNAIRSQGRAGNQDQVVAHIKKRVKALGCSGSIFDPYK